MTLTAPRRSSAAIAPLKAAILAGQAQEDGASPRALTEIGGKPVLWHNMMHFGRFGVRDFVVALGYRGEQVKRYMLDYASMGSSLTVSLKDGVVKRDGGFEPDWQVDLIDTGIDTMSGGRLRQLRRHIGNATFLLTSGDGVSDIDLDDLMEFHRAHGRLATVVAVRPQARFGRLDLDGDAVAEFTEKPRYDQGWTIGSIFLLEPGVFDYIDCDAASWEGECLERLAADGQLMAYRHASFWQGIETLRDRQELEALWQSGDAPWKTWA